MGRARGESPHRVQRMQNEQETEDRMRMSMLAHAESAKRQRMEHLHLRRVMDAATAKIVSGYWERVGATVDRLEQHSTAAKLARDLERDLDELKSLRMHLMLGSDRHLREAEILQINRLIEDLGAILAQLCKRRRHLSDEALMRYLLWNPATPNTMPKALRDAEKDKQNTKASKAKARNRAANQEQRTEAAKPAQAPQKERTEADPSRKRE